MSRSRHRARRATSEVLFWVRVALVVVAWAVVAVLVGLISALNTVGLP